MDTDEHPRPETTMDSLAKLPPVFKKGGTVNAGNASVSSMNKTLPAILGVTITLLKT